jgi:hypothetical protein
MKTYPDINKLLSEIEQSLRPGNEYATFRLIQQLTEHSRKAGLGGVTAKPKVELCYD